MKHKFTTSCFIRKNTSKLRNMLNELGYEAPKEISDNEKLCIVTSLIGSYTIISEEMFDSTNPHITWNCNGRIDCGSNDELFLSLVALRKDTDKAQWFCDNNGLWEKSYSDLPSRYMQMNGHKATVEEIIKQFNKNENV